MSFLSEVRESFHDLTNFEIVLIDDGSEKPLIQNIKKELISDELKVIRNNFNIGQTPSIKLGIENSKGEIIALMDGDGQNPPSEVRKLYDIFCSKDLDAVVSYREKEKIIYIKK